MVNHLYCFLWFVPFLPLISAGRWPHGGGGGGNGNGGLPQVDLGYEIHQAISLNETAQTYNFSNIRFAQPPVGDLRFAAPVAPTGRDAEVQDGSVGRICPQASPAWGYIAQQFIPALLTGQLSSFNYTRSQEELAALIESGALSRPPDPRTTEDCLFLDVIVPKAIFDNSNNRHRQKQGSGAPVLVWIYGGGFVGGEKAAFFNPGGLIRSSQTDGSAGVIFVALNYRLGALGWLSGPTLQAAGGVSNAGLYDQRLALEWVQKYIHLFGGDPAQVTVMGESAGGSSIEYQLTAFGGQRGAPFKRVIPQSPAFAPIASQFVQENSTQTFLGLLGVSSIADARQLDSAAVIQANSLQVGNSGYGQYVYGPVADGIFAPLLPSLLFNAGAYVKDIEVLVGHNTNEGIVFTPPFLQTEEQLAAYFPRSYPSLPRESLDYILNVLYPAVYDGSYPYTSLLERVILIVAELAVNCNTNFINKAYGNETYAYEFEVPPALHGSDVQYTFYNGQGTNASEGLFAPVAEAFQGYITNFVKTGNPNGPGLPVFPIQGMNASMNGINVTGIETKTDPTANERCAWWQKGLIY